MLPLPEHEPFVREVPHVERNVQHDTNVCGDDVLSGMRETRPDTYIRATYPYAERLHLDRRIPLCDENERTEDDDADR